MGRFKGNYVTTDLYVDQSLGRFGGVGLTYIHDLAANTLVSDNIYLDYAYQFDVGEKGVLSIGVELGYFQKSLDWETLTFGNLIDPTTGFVYDSSYVPRGGARSGLDVGTGALYYNDLLFVGYALHHVNMPNQSLFAGESRLPMLHNLYVGAMFEFGELTISPQVDIKMQNSFNNLLGLIKANYKWITLGVGARNRDAFVGCLGVFRKRFRVDYSYDYTISKLSSSTGGSHEVSFMLLLNTLKKSNDRALRIY